MFTLLAVASLASAFEAPEAGSPDDPASVYLEERAPLMLGWDHPSEGLRGGATEVVGGQVVTNDNWPDVAAVVFDGQYVGCTGTLIAPDLVLTAAHCADGISDVILNTKDYASAQGEMISVSRVIVHNSYYSGGYDIAVLELARTTTIAPRLIATDCVRDLDLQDGANVAVVGYGAINERGDQYSSKLHEGFTTIDDAECDQSHADGVYMGCENSINPGGEIGAGGDGVDACFGDSGGPLYLQASNGRSYLTGVTSRAYAGVNPTFPCRDGGIFVRADAVMEWVENVTGRSLARPQCNTAPQVITPDLVVESGGSETADLEVVDDGRTFTVDLLRPPVHGSLQVTGNGVIYTADRGYEGNDSFEIRVTDDGSDYPASGPLSTTDVIDVLVTAVGDTASTTTGDDDDDAPRGDDDDDDNTSGGATTYTRLGRGCSLVAAPSFAGWLMLAPLALMRRRGTDPSPEGPQQA